MISILVTCRVAGGQRRPSFDGRGVSRLAPRSAAPPPGVARAERTVDVLKWMFLRLRDVDTSLCFTAAAAAEHWWRGGDD